MARDQKKRKKEVADAEWEREDKQIQQFHAGASEMKKALRAKGCHLSFYDFLDSFEDEFTKLVAWAKVEFRSLHEVYEATSDEMDVGWQRLGLPADWKQVTFTCDDEHASSYNDDDPSAGIRGGATSFHDESGGLHTIVEVVKNPRIGKRHKEHIYAFKIPILFHELGHVKDYEQNINFNRLTGSADLIEAEVFAHLFALEQCFRRGYYVSADSWILSLKKHKDGSDYRAEVVRRVLERFQRPDVKSWQEY